MLGRVIRSVALVAALAVAVPAAVQAQGPVIYGGGGLLFGVGDTGDVTDTGWMVLGGLVVPVGGGNVGIGGEGVYGNLGITDFDASLDMYGLFGTLGVIVGEEGNVRPYFYVGAGLLGGDIEGESSSEFGYEGVAGLDFPVGDNVGIFGEARYMGSSELDFFGGVVGIAVAVG